MFVIMMIMSMMDNMITVLTIKTMIILVFMALLGRMTMSYYELYPDLHGSMWGILCLSGSVDADVKIRDMMYKGVMLSCPGPVQMSRLLCWRIVCSGPKGRGKPTQRRRESRSPENALKPHSLHT